VFLTEITSPYSLNTTGMTHLKITYLSFRMCAETHNSSRHTTIRTEENHGTCQLGQSMIVRFFFR